MKKRDLKKYFMTGIILITTAIMTSKMVMAAENNSLMETENISENSLQMESTDIQISAENFPDPVFRQYLSNRFDTDKDGKISSSSINTISINGAVQSQYANLRSVEGIAYFPYLQQINITNTNLESIDISSNRSMFSMDVSNNHLTSIDLRNTTLSAFRCKCDGNQLEVNADHIDPELFTAVP